MYNTGTSVQRDDDRQKKAGDGSERLSARPNMTVTGTGVCNDDAREKNIMSVKRSTLILKSTLENPSKLENVRIIFNGKTKGPSKLKFLVFK